MGSGPRGDGGGGSASAFLAGFMLGGVVGAGIALLKAPRSGQDTRHMIEERVHSLEGQARHTAEEVRTQVKRVGDQLSESAKHVQHEAQKAAEQARAEANQVRDKLSESAEQVQKEARQTAQEVRSEAKDVGQEVSEGARRVRKS